MDEITRFRTKIGDNEFEAEGPREDVLRAFQDWQELVKLMASAIPAPVQPSLNVVSPVAPVSETKAAVSNPDSELQRIMRTDGRYISLTARTASIHEAVLLMMYGQKVMRNNDAVTGAELLSGLATSGGFGTVRLDRILEKIAADGDVMSFGERRGKKYRLTNTGINKARSLASELIAAVA